MRRWHSSRGAAAAFVVASLGAALVVACASFGSTADTPPPDEAGLADSAGDTLSTSDGGVVGDAGRFCDQYKATALICDDFEENGGGIVIQWLQTKMNGKITVAAAPERGPAIPFDNRWHHVHMELVNHGGPDGGPDAGGDAGAFGQKVVIDGTVIDQKTVDLSKMDNAQIDLGVLAARAAPGQPDAVVYFDNVLLRPGGR
jgi:hypothetical protein